MTESESNDTISPGDMQLWLQNEVSGLKRATELRLKDATDFVTSYAQGRLTAEQAMKRLMRYESRWGDSPIQGVFYSQDMPDDDILRRLDEDGSRHSRDFGRERKGSGKGRS